MSQLNNNYTVRLSRGQWIQINQTMCAYEVLDEGIGKRKRNNVRCIRGKYAAMLYVANVICDCPVLRFATFFQLPKPRPCHYKWPVKIINDMSGQYLIFPWFRHALMYHA
jgi:hypothetical protein